jgi:hypothetical protein
MYNYTVKRLQSSSDRRPASLPQILYLLMLSARRWPQGDCIRRDFGDIEL